MNRHTGSRIGVKKDPQKIRKISNLICLWVLLIVCITFISFVLTKLITTPLHIKSFEPCKPRIVGVYQLSSSRDATFDQISKLTHIVLNPLRYQRNGTIGFVNEEQKQTFERINRLSKKTKVKTMFALEVGNLSEVDLPGLMKYQNRQRIFVDSIVSFITDHTLDGINLHWEPPHTKSVQMFVTKLFKDMREELTKTAKQTDRKEPFIITTTIQRKNITLDFDEVLKYVDFLNLETDRIHWHEHRSGWSKAIGPPSPLYSGHNKNSADNIDSATKKYSCLTGQPNKINLMVSFFGCYWKNVIPPSHHSETLWMTAKPVNGRIEGGIVPWRDMENRGWNVKSAKWNDDSLTPYIWNSTERTYLAFENQRSLEEKIEFAIEKNVGGFTIFNIMDDDDNHTLLNVLSPAKLCSGKDSRGVKYNCD